MLLVTRKALDDVDAGRVIDHQAVQAWADSLSIRLWSIRAVESVSQLARLPDFSILVSAPPAGSNLRRRFLGGWGLFGQRALMP